MSIEAFQTLDNGTLVDYALDVRQYITIRAGQELIPNRRPVVLQLTPADAIAMIQILKDLFMAEPVDVVLQSALDAHRAGATHDCGEWSKGGVCAICLKDLS